VTRATQVGSAILDVPPNGLDTFFKKGGRLLLSHGWADGLIPSQGTIEFYSAVAARRGAGAGQQVELFMVPGMGHCAGGDGPFVIDVISTIDDWVHSGRAPERITASNPPGALPRTRPLCPYPQQAVYKGTGSTDEADNFKCATPGG
jgi:feruloyl esterase